MNQDTQNQTPINPPAASDSSPSLTQTEEKLPKTPPQELTPPLKPTEAKPKKSGLPIKTFLLILALATITAVLLFIALKNNEKVDQTSPGGITPNVTTRLENPVQTTLTISSAAVRLSTPSAYSTDIVINTGQDVVNKVQLEISYDPKQISNVAIDIGKFFTDPQILLKNIDQANGRITFAIGVQDGEVGVLGQGVVAKLNFTAYQSQATTSISLLPKTVVTADGYSQSVLKTKVDGLFNLNEAPFKATNSSQ